MQNIRHYIGELSPITVCAALSVVALLCVIGYQVNQSFGSHQSDKEIIASSASSSGQNDSAVVSDVDLNGFGPTPSDPTAASSSDPDHIGRNVVGQLATHFIVLQQTGSYSPDAGTQVATDMAPNVRATIDFKTYSESDIKTDSDTSYKRMLAYRKDLQASVAPLLKNSTPELTIFARYTNTKDPIYLKQLQVIAQNYHDAADATAKVVVPVDAVSYHVAILNAMNEFGTTLDALTSHTADPIATAALLRTYNTAEQDMFNSFDALSSYYTSKHI